MKIINENGRNSVEEIAEYQSLRVVSLLESMKKDDPKTYGVIAISLTRRNGFVHVDAEDASPLEILQGLARGVVRVVLAVSDGRPIADKNQLALILIAYVQEELERLLKIGECK